MSIQLIAIDIDGTLLSPDKTISPRVHQAIQDAKAKGVYVVLCTGRPLPGVTAYLEELNLVNDRDFVITYNGSLVQKTADGHTLAHFTLAYEDLEKVASYGDSLNIHYHAIDQEAIYVPTKDVGIYSLHEQELVGMPIRHLPLDQIPKDIEFTKMMFIDDAALLDQLLLEVPKEFASDYTLLRSQPFYLEVLNPLASKGKAVAALAEQLELTPDQVMCIGDNENDMDMIEYAGIGVAMGNAVDSVKAIADYITESDANDGVAVAIERFVL